MKLEKTRQYMEQKLSEEFFSSYGLLVGVRDQVCTMTSPDVDMDTYFDIASMGKVLVTATLILHAAGEGKLSIDDTLSKHFDNVTPDKADITLKQLLTHTSGIRRYQPPKGISDQGSKAVAGFIFSTPLAFAPGSRYEYSCSGYLLLGFIAEQIYGMRLDKVFEAIIRKPLGLTRSMFNPPRDDPNMAKCYYSELPGEYLPADHIIQEMKGIGGNGASFWTLADIQKFVLATLKKEPRFYPEAYFDLVEQDYTPNYEEGRGLGYQMVDHRYTQTGKLFPTGSFGHCGNTGTSFFMNRESGLYVILLTNATRHSYMRQNYESCNYEEVMKMREEIHNLIYEDLTAQKLI